MEEIFTGVVVAIAIILGYNLYRDTNLDPRMDGNKETRKIEKEKAKYEKEAKKEQEEMNEELKSKSKKEVVKRFFDVFSRKPGSGSRKRD